MFARLLSGLVLLSVTAAAQRSSPPMLGRTALTSGVVAITNATVVTMSADSVIRDATVLVGDGRIAAVGPSARVAIPTGARRIDGRGKFVMPGLADMHAHLYADEWVADSIAAPELAVMLALGTTTARMMIGTATHRRLRRSIERGETLGPQLWIASPQVTGNPAPNSYVVHSPDDGRRAVRMASDSGYDFVKLTTDIPLDVYDAIVAEAAARRIRVVGHVDPRVGVAHALAAKQQIEHLDNYMESVLADSAPSRESVSDAGAYRAARWTTLDYVDDRKVDAIAGATARAGVAVTPTMAFFNLWFATEQSDETIRSRPDYALIPPRMRDLYERSRVRYWSNPPSAARRARYIAVRNRLVRAIVDSGGAVMAGSDAPGGLMGYGWTLHRELEMLVAAGLTPWQAIAAATVVPARWLGAEREFGSIAVGRRADLLVLDADPLRDIRNTARIETVMIGGRVIGREEREAAIRRGRQLLNP
jgi:imidazolonepropionase-like amidohydrolase